MANLLQYLFQVLKQRKIKKINMLTKEKLHQTESLKYFKFNISTLQFPINWVTHLNGDYSYIEPIYDPEGGDKSNTQGRRKRTIVDENKMLLFPNPADGFFTVEYQLMDLFTTAQIVVFDMSGKIVDQKEIHYDIDQVIISSENWKAGQYVVSIITENKTVKSQTITLFK